MVKQVNTKEELIRLLNEHTAEILSFGVRKIGIFGSFVKGSVTESSDIDFFVDIKEEYKTLKNFIAFAKFLQTISGRKVEIVTPQSLNKFTGKYITNEVEYVALAA